MNKIIQILLLLTILLPTIGKSQCNTNNSICTPGVAGPFNFGGGGTAVSTCMDFLSTSQYAYIVLYITQSGPLNLLINGNATTGFLDVSIFNIPNGVTPCNAILNNTNQIGCNYALASSGCNQFGNFFPCASSVPAPNVVAGQVLMIVVEDWTNGASSNFTLQLGPLPAAQTGPPNTTINPVGPFCITSPTIQLTAVNMGGTWSGPGVSPSGVFNPATAGPGTHTITYSLGTVPCNSSSTVQIIVTPPPVVVINQTNVTCNGLCNGTATALPNGATYLWSNGLTNQTISGLCPGNYSVTVTLNGCSSSGNIIITEPPLVVVGPINHN